MSLSKPINFHLQYTRTQINVEVTRLGNEITEWAKEVWQNSHTDILTIPILRGGIFFFSDLVREIECSVEIAPTRTWAYENEVNAVELSDVKINLDDVPSKGRCVLLIDDICDSGRTLHAITEALLKSGAREVRSAVLIKRILDKPTFEPTWVGFKYKGPEWFVGYGMDDGNRWRNMADICIIKQS